MGCHGSCADYLAEREEREKIRKSEHIKTMEFVAYKERVKAQNRKSKR